MGTTIARVFRKNGRQAVCIPKAMEFQGVSEVEIAREGDTLVLRPRRKQWAGFAKDAARIGPADDDFMRERAPQFDPHRVSFDDD